VQELNLVGLMKGCGSSAGYKGFGVLIEHSSFP
jgi:hypothetical protein